MPSSSPGGRGGRSDVSRFLKSADGLLYDYLGSIEALRSLSQGIAAETAPSPTTKSDIAQSIDKAIKHSAARRVAGETSGDRELIKDTPLFAHALQATQRDVKLRVDTLSPGERFNAVDQQLLDRTLEAGPKELNEMFGSTTHGWDTLADIKLRIWQPDPRSWAIDAWIVNLVSTCERLVREFVALALSTLGEKDVSKVLDRLFEQGSGGPNVPLPRPSRLIHHRETLDAIVAAVAEHSEQGSAQTMAVANVVAEVLGFNVFPAGLGDDAGDQQYPEASPRCCPGIEPGFVNLLAWMCPADTTPSAERIWNELVGLRRRAIHGPTATSGSSRRRVVPPIYKDVHQAELPVLSDFVGAIGLRFGLMLMLAVVDGAPPVRASKTRPSPEGLRVKLGAEFRVISKILLEQRRYALAWTLCELAMTLEGGRTEAPMLALNAFFARQSLRRGPFITKKEILAYEIPPDSARYRLLKRTLLGDFKQIEKVLEEVMASGNMTVAEVNEWPALEPLRTKWDGYEPWNAKVLRGGGLPPAKDRARARA